MSKLSRTSVLLFVAVIAAFLAFFARFLVPEGMVPYDFKRWVLFIALGAIVFCFRPITGIIRPPNYLLLVGVGFFLFSAFFSTFLTYYSPYQWVEPFYWLWVAFACVSVFSQLAVAHQPGNTIYWVCVIGVLASFSYSLLVIFLYLVYLGGNERVFEPLIISGFANIRYWSHLATILVPLLPVVAILSHEKGQKLFRIFSYIVGSVFWWLIFLTVAKGAALSMALAALLTICMFRAQVIPWLKISLVNLAAGFSAYIVFSVFIPEMLHQGAALKGVGHTLSVRLEMWTEAIRMSVDTFPLGQGSMSWVMNSSPELNERFHERYSHPHNMYLLFAAEYGWLAVLGICCLGMEVVRRLWTASWDLRCKTNSVDAILVVSFSVSVIGSVIHAGASMVFLSPSSMMYAIFTVPIFWLLTEKSKRTEGLHVVRKRHTPFLYGCWVLLAGLYFSFLVLIFQYYGEMKNDEPVYREALYNGYAPRFWFHGEFPRPTGD